ncbi:MAG TPA: ABC transporter substrate-binding protein [Gemmatimonadales bacterium]|jgi:hypothetical protein|nr:ABC transporter substrate-binding protein [Gemmatimonadales bacterium]
MMRRTAWLFALLAGACARPSAVRVAPAAGGACRLDAGRASHVPAVTVALTDSVDPAHAPVPLNDAERVVFGQLYETLLRFDCEGRPMPGLAESWTSSDGGRRWTLTLRAEAQFWDGAPVTARDVVVGKGGAGFTLSATDARVVTVALARGTDSPPAFLADPALAIVKPAPDRGWPIGTGRYWVTGATTTPQEIRAQTTAGDTLVFRLTTGRDPRDLLDAGVDLLITHDRAVLDYAATQPRFATLELPWDRAYLFAAAEPPTARLDGLEQAVRAEARRAEGPFWWEHLDACGPAPAPAPAGTASAPAQRRTVFPRRDGAARDLAGRIAALTHGVAAGLAPADFARALAAGTEAGYVFPVPRQVADPCRAARDLLPPWPSMVAALVDTRSRAVVRRGGSLWVVDWDGTVHVAPQ